MIVIKVEDYGVTSLLNKLSARLSGGMRPVMASIGAVVRDSVLQNFDNMASPEGVKWKDLAPATKLNRLRESKSKHFKRGKKATAANLSKFGKTAMAGRFEILRSKSGLYNSIGDEAKGGILRVENNSVTIGTRIPYAAIHQFGGQAGRGRKVTIPARPYMGVSPAARGDIIDLINSYFGTVQR